MAFLLPVGLPQLGNKGKRVPRLPRQSAEKGFAAFESLSLVARDRRSRGVVVSSVQRLLSLRRRRQHSPLLSRVMTCGRVEVSALSFLDIVRARRAAGVSPKRAAPHGNQDLCAFSQRERSSSDSVVLHTQFSTPSLSLCPDVHAMQARSAPLALSFARVSVDGGGRTKHLTSSSKKFGAHTHAVTGKDRVCPCISCF